MPRIIGLAGQKGGSGKTTTAVNLADAFSNRGKAVLLVDLDPQRTALTALSASEKEDEDSVVGIAMMSGFHEKLERLAAGYDVVVIDCPPGQGELQRAAMLVADMILVPCGPSPADLWSLAGTFQLIQQAQMMRPSLNARLVLTRVDSRTHLGERARDTLEGALVVVMEAQMGLRVAYQESLASGTGVITYAPGSTAANEVEAIVDELETVMGMRQLTEVV